MFAVDLCDLPETGGSTFVLVAGLFVLVAGVIVARWVRQSAGRMSVVVAPIVLLGGLVLAPQVADPCAPTTTVGATTTVAPSTTTTVAPSTTTTVTPVVYSVGDIGPGGGIVFYDAGSTQSWGRYLEAACAGWQNNCDGTTADPQVVWGCDGTGISGADGLAIGTGQLNTTEILGGCLTAGIAADLAHDYSHNFSDWFLPSQDELNQMRIQQAPIGGFSSGFYWSSSENDDNQAWYQNFYWGNQTYGLKVNTLEVRPVRAF